MDEIIRLAGELGKRIAVDARTRAYVAAREAVDADATATQIVADHAAQVRKIRDLEAAVKPVEVADKQRLEELHHQLMGNDRIKELLRTETDYAQMMHHVHQALEGPLIEALAGPDAAAEGSSGTSASGSE
jgi:cell fate (sporulation/competence/biofilm development) regulator YlbF (YheA/YmcA/DUF963 family)